MPGGRTTTSTTVVTTRSRNPAAWPHRRSALRAMATMRMSANACWAIRSLNGPRGMANRIHMPPRIASRPRIGFPRCSRFLRRHGPFRPPVRGGNRPCWICLEPSSCSFDSPRARSRRVHFFLPPPSPRHGFHPPGFDAGDTSCSMPECRILRFTPSIWRNGDQIFSTKHHNSRDPERAHGRVQYQRTSHAAVGHAADRRTFPGRG